MTRMCLLRRGARTGSVALLAAIGCSDLTTACTLIGCESGVTVQLSALPSQPFRVELRASGGDVAYVFDCTADSSRCRQDIFFPGLIAERLFVTVRVGTASRVTEIAQVTYARRRPNGPSCPPDCATANVTAAIPG
jgi:hypothetical protein